MSQIVCGIIGCGVIAPTHVQSYQRLDNVQVAWACDLQEARARKVAEQFKVPRVTTDYREVLADPAVTCVSICTDHASHAPLAAAALAAGKHVLCEKSLAASKAGLDEMFAAHRQHPRPLFAGVFQHRYDPINRTLKALVEEGAFGTLLTSGMQMRCLRTKAYYDSDAWRGTWGQEGGAVLINQAIHYIDLLVWLNGGVAALSGAYANLTHQDCMETEDTATAALRFKSGALGTLEATCSSHLGWEPTLSFHGTEGSLDLRHDQILKISFQDKAREQEVGDRIRNARAHEGVAAGKTYYGTGHPAQIADFVDAIRQGRAPFVPATAARHTVEVVLGIYESHRQGKWVNL
jgi:predicted dehydrogenase